MYLPRVTSAGPAAQAAPVEKAARQVTSRSRRTAAILTPKSGGRFQRAACSAGRLPAVGGVVLLLVPLHPELLDGLARKLPDVGGSAGGAHQELLLIVQVSLPGGLAAHDLRDPVIDADEHGAVSAEPEPHAAVQDGDSRRAYAYLDGGSHMGSGGDRDPQPSAIHPDADRLVRRRSVGRQEEGLGESREANGMAAARAERGANTGRRPDAVTLADLGPQLGGLPGRVAFLEHLGPARERHHDRRQLERLGRQGPPRRREQPLPRPALSSSLPSYRPVQRGGRFSKNAAMPSLASSDSATRVRSSRR